MWGGGNEGSLDALPISLGSTLILLRPPTLAGPGGIPLIGTFPDPAPPAMRAKEAVGAAASRSARTILAEMFAMRRTPELVPALCLRWGGLREYSTQKNFRRARAGADDL